MGVKEAIEESALYMSIKKAFTPYAVLHMLRQMQMAIALRSQMSVEEKYPLLFYTVSLELDGPLERVSHVIRSQVSQHGMSNLTCTCPFSTNYRLICHHQMFLLQKLQIKNINAFEHLSNFRDTVGRRVLKANKKDIGGEGAFYQVKKEKRLKSWIEGVTKKHKDRVNKAAE